MDYTAAGPERADALSVDAPIYNIGAVSRMTGVPVATLRVWDRRYAFPATERTQGGHRLYSDRDVAEVRWVKARVDEGMQVGRAVKALAVAESRGSFPAPPTGGQLPTAHSSTNRALASHHARLTEALVHNDLEAADLVLGEVLAFHPLEDLILQVMRPSLVDVGDQWSEGRTSIATEHLASAFLRQRLLVWLAAAPIPRPVRPVVLTCAPNEWHDVGLLMLGVLLARGRWPIRYLGQATPLADLATFVADVRPSAVIAVAMSEETAEAMLPWPVEMPDVAASGRPPLGYGGAGFSDQGLRARMAGHYLGDTLQAAASTAEALLISATGMQ